MLMIGSAVPPVILTQHHYYYYKLFIPGAMVEISGKGMIVQLPSPILLS
jgi:hypothetical protein